MKNETRTAAILQRVPVILAVTASSFGLQAGRTRQAETAGEAQRNGRPGAEGRDKPSKHQ